MATSEPARLIVLTGSGTATGAHGVEQVISRIRSEQGVRLRGTAVVHHDLSQVADGLVRRRLRLDPTGGPRSDETTTLRLAHGCVSCTLREDVLPLLRALGARPDLDLVVLHLDPVLEPEQVCWAIDNVLTDGATVTETLRLRGVLTVLDVDAWLRDATGILDVADTDLATLPDDERTLAQLVVGQAEFADLIVLAGSTEPWQLLRTHAVLDRLNPPAPRARLCELDEQVLLERLPFGSRRGRPDHPWTTLLRGQPPLHDDAGVALSLFRARRPFHPERLHTALDALLDGVVRARGRIWLATRPDAALWIESAGGGLQIGYVDDWLAAAGPDAWSAADPERRTAASLGWHPRWGDRIQELAILSHRAEPDEIDAALRAALLDDAELADEPAWPHYPDPFGWWHTDPCDEVTPQPARLSPDHEHRPEDPT